MKWDDAREVCISLLVPWHAGGRIGDALGSGIPLLIRTHLFFKLHDFVLMHYCAKCAFLGLNKAREERIEERGGIGTPTL
jgi:hypothetical protein